MTGLCAIGVATASPWLGNSYRHEPPGRYRSIRTQKGNAAMMPQIDCLLPALAFVTAPPAHAATVPGAEPQIEAAVWPHITTEPSGSVTVDGPQAIAWPDLKTLTTWRGVRDTDRGGHTISLHDRVVGYDKGRTRHLVGHPRCLETAVFKLPDPRCRTGSAGRDAYPRRDGRAAAQAPAAGYRAAEPEFATDAQHGGAFGKGGGRMFGGGGDSAKVHGVQP
jgi:hypothetical protein